MPITLEAELVSVTAPVPPSFDEAYRAYVQPVARWARQLGGVEVDVEDVVQEVFLVVSRRLGSFRGEARFSSWLFAITRRVAANHRRRRRWRFWDAAAKAELTAMPAAERDPLAELEQRRIEAQVYRALDRLPQKYRTVLILYEMEGLSTREIAELCELNLSTLKVRLYRAREKFVRHYRHVLEKGAP